MKFKIVTFLFILGIIHSFSACKFSKSGEGELTGSPDDSSTFETLKEDLEILNNILYLLPSPGEIVEGFFNSDLEYKQGLVNSVEKKDSYLGSRSQALNLGVYVTDLAYLAKFGLTGESVDYFEAVRSLSTQVGVSTEIFESLMDRARTNISDPDSMVLISNEACNEMFAFLETSKKESILAVISAGAYIESLYLVLETEEEFMEDDPIFARISEMKYPFENLFSMAKVYGDDENVAGIIKYLNLINQTFEQLAVDETETTVTKKEGKLVIGGGTEFTLTAENFKEMKSAIRSIRTEITTI